MHGSVIVCKPIRIILGQFQVFSCVLYRQALYPFLLALIKVSCVQAIQLSSSPQLGKVGGGGGGGGGGVT